MLLLIPAQKANEEDGGTTTNISNSNNNSRRPLSPTRSSPSTSTSGRVLVVLPSHTDLTSKLTVSDSPSSLLTTTTSFQHNQRPNNNHHYSSSSPYTGYNGGGGGGMDPDTFARLRYSSSSSSSSSSNISSPRPHRSRSRSQSSRRASGIPSSLSSSTTPATTTHAHTHTHTHTHTPTTSTAKLMMRSASTTNASMTKSIREAFKKSMTVHSPLLTSTSSGMVLDLSRGPESNITISNSGKNNSGPAIALMMTGVDVGKKAGERAAGGVGLALKDCARQPKQQQLSFERGVDSLPLENDSGGYDVEIKSRKRSQEEMMEDLGSGAAVNSEPMDVTPNDSNRDSPMTTPQCHNGYWNRNDLGIFDAAAISKGLLALDVDADPPPPSKKTAVSRLQLSSSLSSSSLSVSAKLSSSTASSSSSTITSTTSQSQSPHGSRSSSSSPSLVLPSSSSSSPGSITSPSLQSSPAPALAPAVTTRRTLGGEKKANHCHNEEEEDDDYNTQDQGHQEQPSSELSPPLELAFAHAIDGFESSSPDPDDKSYNNDKYKYYPTLYPIQSQVRLSTQQQHQQQYQGLPFVSRPLPPSALSSSTPVLAASVASLSHPLHPPYSQQPQQQPLHPYHQQQQQQQQQLPSCYYLPPSAFRTASAVAAEAQLEAAERKRKEEKEVVLAAIDAERERRNVDGVKAVEQEQEGRKQTKVEEEVGEEEDEFLIFPSPSLS
ncbi:MAG: hypothetical protein J3R72DRAFT_473623 [Linnemannia gamsii]|nr:MAG: hypothetical protein J3R72DRAFT_473623 [Linnemannia gamsii]